MVTIATCSRVSDRIMPRSILPVDAIEPLARTLPGTRAHRRAAASRRRRRRRRDRRRGLHRAVDGVRAEARPIRRCASWSASARSSGSARRAATAVGARRSSREPRRDRAPARSRRRDRDAARDVRRRRRDRTGRRGRRTSTATGRAAAPSQVATLPAQRRAARSASSPTTARGASAKTTTACSRRTKRARCIGCEPEPRRAVHAALRGDPSRRSWRTASRARGRAARRARSTSTRRSVAIDHGQRAHRARRRPRRRRRARDRGVQRATCPACERAIAPVYSLMIATEPLPDAFWAGGRPRRRGRRSPTSATSIIYGQRTADGRFAFGGRGTPYHFGSRVQPAVRRATAACSRALHATLREPVPDARRRRGHAPLGRRGRRAARLVPVGRLRPRDGHGVGRRLRRRRRQHDEPRRSHARRSRARTRHRPRAPAVGRPRRRRNGNPSRCAGSASTRARVPRRLARPRRSRRARTHAAAPQFAGAVSSAADADQSKFGIGGSARSQRARRSALRIWARVARLGRHEERVRCGSRRRSSPRPRSGRAP